MLTGFNISKHTRSQIIRLSNSAIVNRRIIYYAQWIQIYSYKITLSLSKSSTPASFFKGFPPRMQPVAQLQNIFVFIHYILLYWSYAINRIDVELCCNDYVLKEGLTRNFESAPFAFFLIVLFSQFEITLRMVAYRAYFGSGFTDNDMSAVTADPNAFTLT